MSGLAARGAQRSLTLAFLDGELERSYQLAAGRESLNGFRTIALVSGVVWAIATVVLPVATNLEPGFAIAVAVAMSAISFVIAAMARWATTLDRQHLLATLLTTSNGVVIIALALIGGVLPGYAVAATTLLFVWGYVARTRFIYAAARTAGIGVVFVAAVALYEGQFNMALDVLFFVVAAVGTLLALRLLENSRRRLYFQEIVIREQSEQLQGEMAKSERLILNILPKPIAMRLRGGEDTIADEYELVSVLFADIVGFTPLSARLSASEVVSLLSELFSAFDELVADRGLEKIKTIGDSYMAVGGLTGPSTDQAVSIVSLGLAMQEEATRHEALGDPVRLRIGVHSGPVVGGVIGTRKLAFDLWGDTVNVASRIEGLSEPGRVLVSEATWQLVNSRFDCEAQADVVLRGHSTMRTYSIRGPASPSPIPDSSVD